MEKVRNERNASLELLRIIAMLLIVATHFWGKCIDLAAIEPFQDGYIFGWFIKGICYVNINLYVLLSTYFLCTGTFRIKKLVLLWAETEFYSVLLFVLSLVMGWQTFSFGSLVTAVFPVCNSEYWYITIYFGLYILSPFINKFIGLLSREQLLLICIITSVLFCVIPNIFFNSIWLNFGGGTGIVWFITLYFIGSYIRLFDIQIKKRTKFLVITLLLILLPGISRIIIVLAEKLILGRVIGAGLLYFNNSVSVLPASILVFLIFSKIKIRAGRMIGRLINTVASGSLAVYLIHDNPNIRGVLWKFIEKYVDLSSMFYPAVFFAAVFGIYFVCLLIDLVRQLLFKPLFKMQFGEKIDNYIDNILK